MYREVQLAETDRHLHRFLWRPTPTEDVRDYQMNRVTFGVSSSPHLAVRTLQQTALDHGTLSPTASWHVHASFYVDDLLAGADSPEEAIELHKELRSMLAKGGFDLRKWRSSSQEVLAEIEPQLLEKVPTQDLVDKHSSAYPKALGVVWNSSQDTMSTSVNLPTAYSSTKRGIISDVAKTFDILGWLAPTILQMKVMYQQLWEEKLGWDDPVPNHYQARHKVWRDQLKLLAEIQLPRCYFTSEPTLSIDLHGFSDASEAAYAAVVYVRATYQTQPPTCRLVMAKTKVAPVKTLSMPRLELCGAALLAKLLTTIRKVLNVSIDHVHAWSDSTIVLAWLDGSPKRYKTFIGNRIPSITDLVPPNAWKHVPTDENPADCASRGLSPAELQQYTMWWKGPPWLSVDPVQIPSQPSLSNLSSLSSQEAKPAVCNPAIPAPTEWMENLYSSYMELVRVTAWIRRFTHNLLANAQAHTQILTHTLSLAEVTAAENFLFARSQHRYFPLELERLTTSPPLPIRSTSKLLSLNPFLGKDGLLQVGGRLSNAIMSPSQKHPVILSGHDPLCRLLFKYNHVSLCHCGPTLLLSHVGNRLHVLSARRLARSVCNDCVVCKKASARIGNQRMGQLPAARVNPTPPFSTTGIDYAGPFTLKRGHTRKPVLVKSYIAIFVCFATKAVHLELVSDLTTDAFLAALRRFVSRRGLPTDIHSDNGTNFIGAKNDLADLYRFLSAETTSSSIQAYLLSNRINWHCIPERAPHFGGLWEAAVKSTKHHLRRVIGLQRLDFEEFSTILTQIEACLNSRPLCATTSHSQDGILVLTPGHFLVGRPLQAYPETVTTDEPSLCKRWTLCQSIIHHFWKRWSAEYLQHLQKAGKWKVAKPNLKPGDIVIVTDERTFTNHWVLAKLLKVFTGQDGLVRAVDVQTETVTQPTSQFKDSQSMAVRLKTRTSILRCSIAKLALILPATTSTSSPQALPMTDGSDERP